MGFQGVRKCLLICMLAMVLCLSACTPQTGATNAAGSGGSTQIQMSCYAPGVEYDGYFYFIGYQSEEMTLSGIRRYSNVGRINLETKKYEKLCDLPMPDEYPYIVGFDNKGYVYLSTGTRINCKDFTSESVTHLTQYGNHKALKIVGFVGNDMYFTLEDDTQAMLYKRNINDGDAEKIVVKEFGNIYDLFGIRENMMYYRIVSEESGSRNVHSTVRAVDLSQDSSGKVYELFELDADAYYSVYLLDAKGSYSFWSTIEERDEYDYDFTACKIDAGSVTVSDKTPIDDFSFVGAYDQDTHSFLFYDDNDKRLYAIAIPDELASSGELPYRVYDAVGSDPLAYFNSMNLVYGGYYYYGDCNLRYRVPTVGGYIEALE